MSLDQVVFESRPLDHKDERRALVSAFNGDFNAELVAGIVTSNKPTNILSFHGDPLMRGFTTDTLFHLLSGSAEVIVDGEERAYSLEQRGETYGRLMVPAGRGYLATIGPNSRLSLSFAANPEPAEFTPQRNFWMHGQYKGVTDRGWRYCDNVLDLEEFRSAQFHTLFNAQEAGFTAAQLKFLLPFDKEVVLGGHYHTYAEAYSMWQGETVFRLEQPLTEEVKVMGITPQRKEVKLTAGEKNYFSNAPGIAHSAKAGPHSILVGCTAEVFQGNDSAKPYKNDWLMFKQ